MPLLNYTTKVAADRSVAQITDLLRRNGASEITTMYGGRGLPAGLRWVIQTKHGNLRFEMPINVDKVFTLLTYQRVHSSDPEKRRAQAHRVAWRILNDWAKAQLALLQTEMVELHEIFLPYMLVGDRRVVELLEDSAFRGALIGDGDIEGELLEG